MWCPEDRISVCFDIHWLFHPFCFFFHDVLWIRGVGGGIDNSVPSMSDHSQSIFLSDFRIYSFFISHCLLQKEAWTRLQIVEICGQKHRFSKHFCILAKNSSSFPLGAYVPTSHKFLARFKEPGMIPSCEVGLIPNQKAASYPPNSYTSIS